MHNRILEFVNCMEILYSRQFGFRKGFSTALSLIHLVNSVASVGLDRNEFTVGVFLDLSKVFDTFNLTTVFFSLNSNTTVFEVLHLNGLRVVCLIDPNMFFLIVSVLMHALLSAGYLKGPSWDPCCLYCI